MLNVKLGCTDTPFLASCRCRTRVGHRNGYDSPDTGVRRVSSFFSFFFVSPTRADAAPTRPRHGCDAAPTRPTRQQWRKKGGISQILRNPPLKFSTHPPSDLCRCPLSLAGARSGRSASSIGIEWRRALSLPTISLSLSAWTTGPTSLCVFFFFFPSDFGDWMVMGLLLTYITVTL